MAAEIRRMTVAEVAATRAMLIEVWHETYDAIYGRVRVSEIVGRWHGPERLAAQAIAEAGCLIAIERGAVVGHALAGPDPETAQGTRLWRLYVLASARRHGLGAALMEAAFAACPAHTIQRADVDPDNRAALAFYKRQGFAEARRIGSGDDVTNMPAIVMQRIVA